MRVILCLVGIIMLLGCQPIEQPQSQNPGGKQGKQPPPSVEAYEAAAAFSPDGRWLLTEFIKDNFDRAKDTPSSWKRVTLWRVSTGRAVKTFPEDYRGSAFASVLAFLPDGQHAFSAGYGHWRVFEVPSGKVIREVKGLPWMFYPMALSGDGKRLLTQGAPGAVGNILPTEVAQGIQLWDVEAGRMIQTHELSCGAACLSRDGKRAIVEGGGNSDSGEQITMQLWDFDRGKPVLSLKRKGAKWWGPPDALSPNGQIFVAGWWNQNDMMLYLWDARTGRRVRQMGEVWTIDTGRSPDVAFTADGKHLLVAGGGRLESIAVADGKTMWSVPIAKDVHCAAFTADGTIALTVQGRMREMNSSRMTFTLWDTARGRRLRDLELPD